jgi:hypothetical protein
MTGSARDAKAPQPPSPEPSFAKAVASFLWGVVASFLPCTDLASRYRMRREAYRLVTLRTWPGMAAKSGEAAQLAMLRLLWLQRQTHRAVRGRHKEASAMLARASVEGLLLGLYCLRVPGAIAKLHADNLKALGDGLAYLEEADIAPEQVIRDCVARLGSPSDKYLTAWGLVKAIDDANGNKAARSIYRRLYIPLSNYTVHANGGTLLRHVRRDGRLHRRPSRSLARRSPARVADAAAGFLAADLARRAGKPEKTLLAYADRHYSRTLMPMVVMAFSGMGSSLRPQRVWEIIKLIIDVYTYINNGRAMADSIEERVAYVRERFAQILNFEDDPEIPDDALEPFIDYVADKLANAARPGSREA